MAKIINKFSAISSWVGYEFQGYLALYEALKIINEKGFEETENCFLEIEGTEDFAIIKDNKYVSIHQVKMGNYSDTNQIIDKFNFIITLLENDIAKGYYHLSQSTTLSNDYVKSTYNHINTLLGETNREISDGTGKTQAEKKEIINYSNIRKNKKKGSLESCIQNYIQYEEFGDFSDEEKKRDVENAISLVKADLITHKDYLSEIMKGMKESEVDSKFMKLHDECMSDCESVIENSITQIEEICNKEGIRHGSRTSGDSSYSNRIFAELFNELKRRISDDLKHDISRRVTKGAIIPFREMRKILEKDLIHQDASSGYRQYLFIRSFNKALLNYSIDVCGKENCRTCDTRNTCQLFSEIERVNSMKGQFLEYINNLHFTNIREENLNDISNSSIIQRQICRPIKEWENVTFNAGHLTLEKNFRRSYISLAPDNNIRTLAIKMNTYFKDNFKVAELYYEAESIFTDQIRDSKIYLGSNSSVILGGDDIKDLSKIEVFQNHHNNSIKKSNEVKVLRLEDFLEGGRHEGDN